MKYRIFSIFLFLLFLTACDSETPAVSSSPSRPLSMADIPTLDELNQMDPEFQKAVKLQMEQFSSGEWSEYIADRLEEHLKDSGNVSLHSLVLETDELAVYSGENAKSAFNLTSHLELTVEGAEGMDFEEKTAYAEKILDEASSFLWQFPYFSTKVITEEHKALYPDGYPIHISENHVGRGSAPVFLPQPEDEFAVQTLAFDFGRNYPGLILERFGPIPETGELYIEYYLSEEDYWGTAVEERREKLEASPTLLSEAASALRDILTADETVLEYLKTQGLSAITVSFQSGNLDDGSLTFSYDL